MALSPKLARTLLRLVEGEIIPASSAKGKIIDILISENIIYQKGKHRKTLELINAEGLHLYLANQLQINDLGEYVSLLENEGASRAEYVRVTADSKGSKERAFKGFLVNSYDPIEAKLNNQLIKIEPSLGSFIFIYDYETFKIPEDITLVGVENTRNFIHIEEQRYLFGNVNPMFVSRYPQNQSKDFIKWMKSIPNEYLHFGDFDLAGIGIYLNEYKRHLSARSRFFIPDNIRSAIRNHGNRDRYDHQKMNFKSEQIEEPDLLKLLEIIKFEKKGLDQEYFID
ncbi:MAG TPA: hypothetical protein VKX40_04095 [Aequorivita sp.]|nr:hypothetical protein [Aequorivita sp.]